MTRSNTAPEIAKWHDLYPASWKNKPASFSDCLTAITSRSRSFFREITLDVKPVWITGIVTGISEYKEDCWYVDLRGPEDAYIKAKVNRKLDDSEEFGICDTVIFEGKFIFISRTNHLDQIQIQFEVIRASTITCGVEYLERVRAKRLLPSKIERIGIITSPKGRAISDFHSGFGKFLPRTVSVEVEEVQLGKSSSILERIREADGKGYDVLVITRGGGTDLDLFNLPSLAEGLRQCKSYTLSALGHTDDEMVFDLNADLSCHTPTAAGTELQNHIHNSRKNQGNVGRDLPSIPSLPSVPFVPESKPTFQEPAVPLDIPQKVEQGKSWISKLEDFNKSLWRWTCALWKMTWITVVFLSCLTVLLYFLQHCAIPAAKTGKEIWDQVHAQKPKVIPVEKKIPEKKSQGVNPKRSSL